MSLVTLRFFAILLNALAMAPGIAHVAALPNKIGLAREAYFAVQLSYRGWALFGAPMIGALALDLLLAWTHRRWRPSFALASVGALAMAAALAAFFIWTWPANEATQNWTIAPETWQALRWRWEFGHALGAAATFVALICVALAALRAPRGIHEAV